MALDTDNTGCSNDAVPNQHSWRTALPLDSRHAIHSLWITQTLTFVCFLDCGWLLNGGLGKGPRAGGRGLGGLLACG